MTLEQFSLQQLSEEELQHTEGGILPLLAVAAVLLLSTCGTQSGGSENVQINVNNSPGSTITTIVNGDTTTTQIIKKSH